MKIGIIGDGAIDVVIAQKLPDRGHDVKIANSSGKQSLRKFADEYGLVHSDLNEISEDIEILIISIPYSAVTTLPESLFEKLSPDVTVVDTGNYCPEMRDGNIKAIDEWEVESVWFSKQIKRPVVKAFNTLLAYSLAELDKSKCETERLAMQIADDVENHKKVFMNLID